MQFDIYLYILQLYKLQEIIAQNSIYNQATINGQQEVAEM